MRILVISDYFQPTIGYGKVAVTKSLIKQGHIVEVLTSNKYFPFPSYDKTVKSILGPRERMVGFHIENGIPIKRKKAVIEFFSRALFFGVKDEIEEFKPDVVIVFTAASFSVIQVALAKKKLNFKLASVDTHLPSELNRGNKLLKEAFYAMFRLFFAGLVTKAIDKVIALQEDTQLILRDYYGINKKIELIDQGTDTEKYRFDKKSRELLRKEFKLTNKDFVVIYTGKIIPAKGVDILFSVFDKLATEFQDIHLCVVGGGEQLYINLCKSKLKKEFQNRVIWVDFQPEEVLYKYYSFADVAVWPLQDSFAMNDAAACSRPFIANDRLGARTRISNNNALLYKQGDVGDLVKKIKYLYKNRAICEKMGKNGRELAEKKLSWYELSKKYIRF